MIPTLYSKLREMDIGEYRFQSRNRETYDSNFSVAHFIVCMY